ncbi:MAG: acetate--CoA ligase family protein [Pyrobaculum sp.]
MREFLFPNSIAVVGASPNPHTVGGQILRQLSRFRGRVYPVNPKYYYRSISELPEPPDLLVVATPAPTVPAIIEEAGKTGVKAAIVVSGGFAEVGRRDLEEELLEAARRHGVRVLGPNCLGVYNAHIGLDTMFIPLERAARPPPGPIAFLSQSGAVMTAALDWAAGANIGVGIAASFGNRIDVTEIELMEFLAGLDEVKSLALYLEGFRRRGEAARFLKAAKAFPKPIVVYKAGRGVDSQRAVYSHTAAMAGSYQMYQGLFRQAGVAEAGELKELFHMAKALAVYSPREVRRVLVVSTSGGVAVQIVDFLNEVGLEVPELPREGQEELRRVLHPAAAVSNPIDLTGGGTDEHLAAALEVGLRYTDAAVVAPLIHPPSYSERAGDYILSAFDRWGKAIVVLTWGPLSRRLGERLVVVETPREAARALSAVASYGSKIYHGGGYRGDQHEGG